jgi:hypothetical protein
MDDKSAAKGVLVTTSWVGKASRDFAARNGRIEIIEGRHLKAMLLEHLSLDALISLPKLRAPPVWIIRSFPVSGSHFELVQGEAEPVVRWARGWMVRGAPVPVDAWGGVGPAGCAGVGGVGG